MKDLNELRDKAYRNAVVHGWHEEDLSDENEEWKDIKGYDGYYQVSNFGRVKRTSFYYVDKYGHKRCRKEKILSQIKNRHGYLLVHLSKDNVKRHIYVHRLVACSFIENPENKPQVNHKNGNKSDNHVSNLEWNTRSENMKHAYVNGLNIPNRSQLGRTGLLSGRGKQILQFDKNMNFIRVFYTAKDAAAFIKCHPTSITKCANGEYKYAHGYIWKWKNIEQKMKYNELRSYKHGDKNY